MLQRNNSDNPQNAENELNGLTNNQQINENPYSTTFEQNNQQHTDVSHNAPEFSRNFGQRSNKNVLLFMCAALVGLLGFGLFVVKLFSEEPKEANPRPEFVTEQDAPLEQPSQLDINPPYLEPQPQKAAAASIPLPLETPQSSSEVAVSNSSPSSETEEGESIDNLRKSASLGDNSGGENSENKATATPTTSAKYLANRDKLLIQGTYLRCVLETKIISELPGFTSCIITEPVYSASGQYLLIPKGAKVIGQYGSTNPTSGRLQVIWSRLITPEGIDVSFQAPGVDSLGAAGHEGKFKSHWKSRLASALLISLISDSFKYAAAEYGPKGTTETTSSGATITNPYESDTADTLKQQAINQLERNNARPNTVTINQGSLINIYVSQDIDFSDVMK